MNPNPDVISQILKNYSDAALKYNDLVRPFALKIFLALVLIELLISAYNFLIDQEDVGRIIGQLFRKVLTLGFLLYLIENSYDLFVNGFLHGFEQIGVATTGLQGLDAGLVFGNGLYMLQTLYLKAGQIGWWSFSWSALLAIGSGVCIFIAFALIAAQILLALIEAYIGIAGGVLILGFSGSRWTMKFAESFIGWYLGVCTKVFFLYLLVGIGLTLSAEWNQTLQNWKGDNISIPIAMAGAAFIFVIVARHISNTAGAMVGQSVTMHAGHLLASAAAVYGGVSIAKSALFPKKSEATTSPQGNFGARYATSGTQTRRGAPPTQSGGSSTSNPATSYERPAVGGGARPTSAAFYNPENGSVWTAPPSQGGTLISKPSQEQAARDARSGDITRKLDSKAAPS
jgi:type IV secretion system protein TrbL